MTLLSSDPDGNATFHESPPFQVRREWSEGDGKGPLRDYTFRDLKRS